MSKPAASTPAHYSTLTAPCSRCAKTSDANALDKLIGHALLQDQLPLHNQLLLLSGRVSFEMVQKALAAGIPIIAAISAPTSLAVEFARENNQTLIGFLRGETMNIYSAPERVQ